MNEFQLQAIWEKRISPDIPLTTCCGKSVVVLHRGELNKDQGPDFSLARIKIDQHEWIGNIELHVRTSDWYVHGHHHDKNYSNVILHVVWIHDSNTFDHAPVLALKQFFPNFSIDPRFQVVIKRNALPCFGLASSASFPPLKEWLNMIGLERFNRKSSTLLEYLNFYRGDWDSVTWLSLSKGFGYSVNADSFYALAKSIPFFLIRTYKYDLFLLEALLFGQSRMLEQEWHDQYPLDLNDAYKMLQEKYGIVPITHPMFFLRMRPKNFPTIRISQLASLYHQRQNIFRYIIESATISDLHTFLRVGASSYWDDHTSFDKPGSRQSKFIGFLFLNNLIINVFVPILMAYSRATGEKKHKDKAIGWLQALDAESNSIIDQFSSVGFISHDALDSQSLLELHHRFCSQDLCLQCALGKELTWPN